MAAKTATQVIQVSDVLCVAVIAYDVDGQISIISEMFAGAACYSDACSWLREMNRSY